MIMEPYIARIKRYEGGKISNCRIKRIAETIDDGLRRTFYEELMSNSVYLTEEITRFLLDQGEHQTVEKKSKLSTRLSPKASLEDAIAHEDVKLIHKYLELSHSLKGPSEDKMALQMSALNVLSTIGFLEYNDINLAAALDEITNISKCLDLVSKYLVEEDLCNYAFVCVITLSCSKTDLLRYVNHEELRNCFNCAGSIVKPTIAAISHGDYCLAIKKYSELRDSFLTDPFLSRQLLNIDTAVTNCVYASLLQPYENISFQEISVRLSKPEDIILTDLMTLLSTKRLPYKIDTVAMNIARYHPADTSASWQSVLNSSNSAYALSKAIYLHCQAKSAGLADNTFTGVKTDVHNINR
ncbi:hypothetical protein CANCADRAFT_82305 [Tortispora caseinolytica NRRL Y-17796]|uniref:PCI domain-containing protein n=1 Tax=Tortispora caseinolytica NRRL Y-17796 TaxID=767744 RepID=A0A1E4TJY9_9ASCO|nr:hypothetical protein CANCADRAFT_82305 [Tortispora caseinolytica NRRL Y-17796]